METVLKEPTKVVFKIPRGRWVLHDLTAVARAFERTTGLRCVGEITGQTTVIVFVRLDSVGKEVGLPALLVERIRQGQVTMLEQLKSKDVKIELA